MSYRGPFPAGSFVHVSGKTGNHGWPIGTLIKLIKFDPADGSYLARPVSPNLLGEWWIWPRDVSAVSENEIRINMSPSGE